MGQKQDGVLKTMPRSSSLEGVLFSWSQNSDVRKHGGPEGQQGCQRCEGVHRPASPRGSGMELRLGSSYVLRNFSDGEVLADSLSFEV